MKLSRNFFLFGILLIFVVLGGVYWFFLSKKQPVAEEEKQPEVKKEGDKVPPILVFPTSTTTTTPVTSTTSSSDYIIKETPEGKIVENQKEGLSFKLPDGWIVQEPTSIEEPLQLISPENKITYSEEGVFKIEVYIRKEKIDLVTLKNKLIADLKLIEGSEILNYTQFKFFKFKGYQALKEIIDTTQQKNKNLPVYYTESVFVPVKDKIYIFTLYSGFETKAKAIQIFDNFLKTVSIK